MLQLIQLICTTAIWINSEPTLWFKRLIGLKEENYDTYSKLKRCIHRMAYCALCSGWWIGFLFTTNILQACIVGVGSELIQRVFNRFK